jgi:hypothetical protein
MHRYSTFLLISLLPLTACSSRGAPPRDPGSPAPAAPRPEVTGAPTRPEREPPVDRQDPPSVPVRADQAPLVAVRDALESDSLLGKRVRVAGRCTAAGEGRRAGLWTLTAADGTIEVRGQVPSSCSPDQGADLTIFAQIESKTTGSRERVLLRLPD